MSEFSFEDLNEWAESTEPVFIVGPERSGTSMMFRAIVSHPAFCTFNNATVETFAFIRPYALLANPGPSNYEMRLYMGSQYKSFQNAITPLRMINELDDAAKIKRGYFNSERLVVWNRRHYRELLRMFFYFSWLNQGEKRMAEKTPAHVRCLREIFDCFPNAKVLVCVRDPIEIIASHKKRFEREVELGKNPNDGSLAWLKKSVDEHIVYLENLEKTIQGALINRPESVFRVPYSAVTKDAQFLRKVFAFIGESFEDISNNTVAQSAKSLEWDPLLAFLPKENAIDIDRYVSAEEQRRLKELAETLCW